MTSKGLKRICTFLARWAILAIMYASSQPRRRLKSRLVLQSPPTRTD